MGAQDRRPRRLARRVSGSTARDVLALRAFDAQHESGTRVERHGGRIEHSAILWVIAILAFVWLTPPRWIGDPRASEPGLIGLIASRF
jgi:hypothetical protein